MTGVLRAASDLQALCVDRQWRFCFIGGLAVLRWGEPRETVDVDLTVLTGFGGENPFIETLLGRYEARVEDAGDFAREHRVLLLRDASGVGLDIALGGLPFEERLVERASPFEFLPDATLRTCSAEDLIVLKAFAARLKDWVDIEGIVVRQAGALDWPYVMAQLAPLVELKDAPQILQELQRVRNAFDPEAG